MSDTTVNSSTNVTTDNPLDNIKYAGDGRVSFSDGTTMSVMEAVSFLFLERSEVFSALSRDKMQESQNNLKEIQEARQMLARMRELKQDAGKGTSEMPDDMVKYCEDHNIKFDTSGDDNLHDKDEWDVNIQYMQAHLDELTDSNQTQFLKLKSTINKLDEAVTAADKMATKNHDAIKSIFRT